MTDANDFLRFIEDEPAASGEALPAWTVAVIDDDPAVHEGTRFALFDYTLNGQSLDILSAYSAAEGRELMRTNPNVAVILLDVVMETDDAGLGLVDYIRNELKNETARIIRVGGSFNRIATQPASHENHRQLFLRAAGLGNDGPQTFAVRRRHRIVNHIDVRITFARRFRLPRQIVSRGNRSERQQDDCRS